MIAFLINELNVCGGTHKQLLELIEYTERQNLDFFIVTKEIDYALTYPRFQNYSNKIVPFPQEPASLKVLKIGMFGSFVKRLWERKCLKKLISSADVINVHDRGFEQNFDVFYGKKIVWQVNDLPSYCHVGVAKTQKNTWKDRILFSILKRNIKYVSSITVNVNKNAERIRELFHRDAQVFYCGISPIAINRDINKTFSRFKERKINLLSSGVVLKYRNYETQVEVVKKLIDKGWNVNLNIFGKILDEEYATKIRDMIKDFNLEKNIKLLGQIDDDEYRNLHKNSDIFLFVNIDQSWGLAVFEAQSCAMPVIVSQSVGAVEILHDKFDCIVINPHDPNMICDAVVNLASNNNFYSEISENAKGFCKEWTWDKAYSSKMIELLS